MEISKCADIKEEGIHFKVIKLFCVFCEGKTWHAKLLNDGYNYGEYIIFEYVCLVCGRYRILHEKTNKKGDIK